MSLEQQTIVRADSLAWRSFLKTFLIALTALCAGCYLAVVLIDPFSTGRFALTQRIDRVPNDSWYWFAKAGIIRDPQFDAAIFGSSVAGPLDPIQIGQSAGRSIAQLALYGAFPRNSLVAMRAFTRHHAEQHPLYIVILDQQWCADTIATGIRRSDSWLPNFPSWVYESSNTEYLSRVFTPFALNTTFGRLGVWLGLRDQAIRADGFAPIFPANVDAQAMAEKLLSMKPEINAPPPTVPFPNLDELVMLLGTLDPRSPALLVFVPIFVNALPPPGSAAAARDSACKARVATIAAQRRHTGFLDLQRDDWMARSVGDYVDALHFRGDVAQRVGAEIAKAIVKLRSLAK